MEDKRDTTRASDLSLRFDATRKCLWSKTGFHLSIILRSRSFLRALRIPTDVQTPTKSLFKSIWTLYRFSFQR